MEQVATEIRRGMGGSSARTFCENAGIPEPAQTVSTKNIALFVLLGIAFVVMVQWLQLI